MELLSRDQDNWVWSWRVRSGLKTEILNLLVFRWYLVIRLEEITKGVRGEQIVPSCGILQFKKLVRWRWTSKGDWQAASDKGGKTRWGNGNQALLIYWSKENQTLIVILALLLTAQLMVQRDCTETQHNYVLFFLMEYLIKIDQVEKYVAGATNNKLTKKWNREQRRDYMSERETKQQLEQAFSLQPYVIGNNVLWEYTSPQCFYPG